MSDHELNRFIEEHKEEIVEMVAFWVWMRGLNKILKWLAIIGIPIAVGVWSFIQMLKKSR